MLTSQGRRIAETNKNADKPRCAVLGQSVQDWLDAPDRKKRTEDAEKAEAKGGANAMLGAKSPNTNELDYFVISAEDEEFHLVEANDLL